MMPRYLLTLTLLLLFIVEGTVLQLFLEVWGVSGQLFPRLTLVALCLVSLFLGRREGLIYGFAFGFLHDVIYNQVIGVYTLATMSAGYFSGLSMLLFHRSVVLVLTSTTFVLFAHEWLLYSLFRFFSTGLTDVQWMLTKQILPSVGLNICFALLLYVPLVKLCDAVEAAKGIKLE